MAEFDLYYSSKSTFLTVTSQIVCCEERHAGTIKTAALSSFSIAVGINFHQCLHVCCSLLQSLVISSNVNTNNHCWLLLAINSARLNPNRVSFSELKWAVTAAQEHARTHSNRCCLECAWMCVLVEGGSEYMSVRVCTFIFLSVFVWQCVFVVRAQFN